MINRVPHRWLNIGRATLFCGALTTIVGTAGAAASAEPGSDPKEPGPGSVHFAAQRTGTIETTDRLTLRLTTDLGSVHIIALDRSAAPTVQYSVHIETDARVSLAKKLL